MNCGKREKNKGKWRPFALICVLFLFPPSIAHGLTISPLRQTITVDPGREQEIRVHLRNEESSEIVVSPVIEAFRLEERTGRPVFGAKDSALQWVTSTWNDIRLRPGEERDAQFIVHVPAKAEPGGHYLGLFVESAPTEGSISAGTRVGSLLFLYIAGEVREKLETVEFRPDTNWYSSAPVRITIRLHNAGTIHVIPDVNVTIETSGGRVVAERRLNFERRKVLPGDDWVGEYVFGGLSLLSLGKLTAVARVEYGLGAQEIIERTNFWRVPIVTLLIIAGFIAVTLAGLIVWRRKQRKRSDRYENIS